MCYNINKFKNTSRYILKGPYYMKKKPKYLVLLIDGAADEPLPQLNGRTPLEAANKPYMNFLAQNGEAGTLNPTPAGCVGGSDTGNMCIMGFDPSLYLTGRSPLEAAALGIKMADDDIAMRVNLVTVSDDEPYEQKTMVDYSAGEISTQEAAELIKFVGEHLGSDTMHFYPGVSYRHCLIINHAVADQTLTPPHNITGQKVTSYLPKGTYSDILLDMMKKSHELLKDHPINKARIASGKRPANSLWMWGQGTKPMLPSFEQTHGIKGAVVTAVDLVRGLAFLADMKIYNVEGATGTLNTNFKGKAEAAITAFKEGADLVYLHLEAPDECGHQKDAEGKVKAIELIDSLVLKPVFKYLKSQGSFGILVTPDHPTPVTTGAHTSGSVPFIIYRSDLAPNSPEQNYCEKSVAKSSNSVEGYLAITRMLHSGHPTL